MSNTLQWLAAAIPLTEMHSHWSVHRMTGRGFQQNCSQCLLMEWLHFLARLEDLWHCKHGEKLNPYHCPFIKWSCELTFVHWQHTLFDYRICLLLGLLLFWTSEEYLVSAIYMNTIHKQPLIWLIFLQVVHSKTGLIRNTQNLLNWAPHLQ